MKKHLSVESNQGPPVLHMLITHQTILLVAS